MTDDDELRDLFHDAVADVHPPDGLARIRRRTSARHSWVPPTLAAVAATVLVLGGVFVLVNQGSHGGAGGPVASASPATPTAPPATTTSSPSPEPGDTTPRAVPVYYVGTTPHGPRLFREFHSEPVCSGADCLLRASVAAATSSPPQDADYRMPWPADTGVGQVSYSGGTLTIGLTGDLRDRPAGMSAAEAQAAVQQLIYSAQAALGEGRPPVRLLLEDKATDQVLGVAASRPLTAENAEAILAPVWIISPHENATENSGFEVTGVAASFEANVVWELRQGSRVVRHGFTTAAECCIRAPYSFTVRAPAGTYTLVVSDGDASGGEGPGPSSDTKVVTIR